MGDMDGIPYDVILILGALEDMEHPQWSGESWGPTHRKCFKNITLKNVFLVYLAFDYKMF